MPGLRHGFGPTGVAVRALDNPAVAPDLARYWRADHRRGVLRPRVGDVFPQIPAIGMYDFHPAGHEIGDGLALIAGTGNGAARPTAVVQWASVVVAELHHHEIAGLHQVQHTLPLATGQEIGRASCRE